jgi:hypothetical protein
MKFLIYLVGLRRTSGLKSGEFFYNEKHGKFIYQNRELDAEEFNTLMAKRWPLQSMANQQVGGFAIVEVVETETETEAETETEDASQKSSAKKSKTKGQ